MKFILLAFLSIAISNSIVAQEDENQNFAAPKHVIHVSAGTFFITASGNISYDYRIAQNETGFFKSYYATLKGGYQYIGTFSGLNTEGPIITAGVTGLTGTGKGHMEANLGLSYLIGRTNDDPVDGDTDEGVLLPYFSIGYRKQVSNGLVFRTGVGFVDGAYIGLGYSF
ncbi:hypothetical protein [Spongiivirga citrea]|uniref:DUF3575 domain-containing protein n=1 Tax=Spongiivirga citrea TaxID=1481457 RepID=A0A6M0CXG0_9FLAO|nr:hypothetical protein [Spongiivirga citrea]NER18420.1 hypothetical protein [Spongiivirga citrea]